MIAFDTVNDVLVGLFRDILSQEEKYLITEEFQDITVNDMHIIESIGIEEPKNMSAIAGGLGITTSTLTTAVNGLSRKGYVERVRSEVDRRVIFIRLTEKGKKAYARHLEFHKHMTKEVLATLNEEETAAFVKGLQGVLSYFQMK